MAEGVEISLAPTIDGTPQPAALNEMRPEGGDALAPLALAPTRLVRLRGRCKSAAHEDGVPKDQDALASNPDLQLYCVADGVSSSPYSKDASETAASTFVNGLGSGVEPEDVLTTIARRLLELRDSAHDRPFKFPESHNEMMRQYMEETFRKKLLHSYQTTLCAVRFIPAAQPSRLEYTLCGDSAVFLFDRSGAVEVLPSSVTHVGGGSATRVLPDDHPKHCETRKRALDDIAHVVLATDGFYHSFDDSAEMLAWLERYENDYDPHLPDLHKQLGDRRGDDDMTFIWLSIEEAD